MNDKIQEPMAYHHQTHEDGSATVVPKKVDDNPGQDWPHDGHKETMRPGKIWGWKNFHSVFNIIDIYSAMLKPECLKSNSQYIIGIGEDDWRPEGNFLGRGLGS